MITSLNYSYSKYTYEYICIFIDKPFLVNYFTNIVSSNFTKILKHSPTAFHTYPFAKNVLNDVLLLYMFSVI